MKRLCLMRHAKSDWSDPPKDDYHRPLNERGERTAKFMADYIMRSACKPDAVLCSTATRALATFEPLKVRLAGSVPVDYRDRLYHAMPDVMLEEIRATDDAVRTLLLVGHNPGLVLLAMALAEDPENPVALLVENGVPTGGLVVFDFIIESWKDVSEGRGRSVLFTRPRDLMG